MFLNPYHNLSGVAGCGSPETWLRVRFGDILKWGGLRTNIKLENADCVTRSKLLSCAAQGTQQLASGSILRAVPEGPAGPCTCPPPTATQVTPSNQTIPVKLSSSSYLPSDIPSLAIVTGLTRCYLWSLRWCEVRTIRLFS